MKNYEFLPIFLAIWPFLKIFWPREFGLNTPKTGILVKNPKKIPIKDF